MEGNDILYSEGGEGLAQVGLRSCGCPWIPGSAGKEKGKGKGEKKRRRRIIKSKRKRERKREGEKEIGKKEN